MFSVTDFNVSFINASGASASKPSLVMVPVFEPPIKNNTPIEQFEWYNSVWCHGCGLNHRRAKNGKVICPHADCTGAREKIPQLMLLTA